MKRVVTSEKKPLKLWLDDLEPQALRIIVPAVNFAKSLNIAHNYAATKISMKPPGPIRISTRFSTIKKIWLRL